MTYITDKKKWYTEQITACQASLYRLAVSLLRDEEDARDALQEALCTGYEKLNSLRDPDKFHPWIMRILHNAAYDILRQRKPSVSLSDIPSGQEPSSTPSFSVDMALGDVVKTLPEEYRTVVILFYYEEMSVRQISEITGLSAGAVKTRLSRARDRLRQMLDL